MHDGVSDFGFACTVWTARVAVAGWFGLLLVGPRAASPSLRLGRALWTFGAAAMIVHVLCAFHFVHGWSQTSAWEHTARRTAETTGFDWGGGLLINEVFLAWWSFDAATLWRNPLPEWRRSAWYEVPLHAVFAFLMVNATVVFGPPHWRVTSAVAAAALIVTYAFRRRATGMGVVGSPSKAASNRSE